MGEGHVADAEAGEFAQVGEVVADHVAAFDAYECGDFSFFVGLADFCGGGGEDEVIGVFAHLVVNGVDLFDGAVDRFLAGDFALGIQMEKKMAPKPPSLMRGMSMLPSLARAPRSNLL